MAVSANKESEQGFITSLEKQDKSVRHMEDFFCFFLADIES